MVKMKVIRPGGCNVKAEAKESSDNIEYLIQNEEIDVLHSYENYSEIKIHTSSGLQTGYILSSCLDSVKVEGERSPAGNFLGNITDYQKQVLIFLSGIGACLAWRKFL